MKRALKAKKQKGSQRANVVRFAPDLLQNYFHDQNEQY
jgi:hypothetical protein